MGIDYQSNYSYIGSQMLNLRLIDEKINNHFNLRKETLILLGARQIGKTTLLKRLFPKATYLLVDNETVRKGLDRYDISFYKQMFVPSTRELVIDEIHLLKDPGRCAKIIYDQIPDMKLIITGSSALHIKNKMGESLAGRKIDYFLYPLTFTEYLYQKAIISELSAKILENVENRNWGKKFGVDFEGTLENVLVYGLYPHMVSNFNDKIYLENLSGSIIFKDLLELRSIENREGALNLLKALAYQIGKPLNVNELSSRLNLETKTINRYLNIFEQSFIIFSLTPYTKSGRDEIGKSKKYYFWDLGVRNALINNFNAVNLRDDYPKLFENFIIAEIKKENYYKNSEFNFNYWKTVQGSEIELVLSRGGELIGLEIGLGGERTNKAFKNRHPKSEVFQVTPQNFF